MVCRGRVAKALDGQGIVALRRLPQGTVSSRGMRSIFGGDRPGDGAAPVERGEGKPVGVAAEAALGRRFSGELACG